MTYGPTGAAKAMFALSPDGFPPWDDPIRARLGFDGGETGYLEYLLWVRATLVSIADEAGVAPAELPRLVGRPASSPPKLVDAYNWIALTRGCPPPSVEEVVHWASWTGASERSETGG